MVVGTYTLAQFLTDYAARNLLTQRGLADHIGVSVSTVNRWIKGVAMPDLEQVVRLSEVTGSSVEAIVGMLYPETVEKSRLSPAAMVIGQAVDKLPEDIQNLIMTIVRNSSE